MSVPHIIATYLAVMGVLALINACGSDKMQGGVRFMGFVLILIDFASSYYLFTH